MDSQVSAQLSSLRGMISDIESAAMVYDLKSVPTNFPPAWKFYSKDVNPHVTDFLIGRASSGQLGEEYMVVEFYRQYRSVRIYSEPGSFVIGIGGVLNSDFETAMLAAGIKDTIIAKVKKCLEPART